MELEAGEALLARRRAGGLAEQVPRQPQQVLRAPEKMPVERDEDGGVADLRPVGEPQAVRIIPEDGVEPVLRGLGACGRQPEPGERRGVEAVGRGGDDQDRRIFPGVPNGSGGFSGGSGVDREKPAPSAGRTASSLHR